MKFSLFLIYIYCPIKHKNISRPVQPNTKSICSIWMVDSLWHDIVWKYDLPHINLDLRLLASATTWAMNETAEIAQHETCLQNHLCRKEAANVYSVCVLCECYLSGVMDDLYHLRLTSRHHCNWSTTFYNLYTTHYWHSIVKQTI